MVWYYLIIDRICGRHIVSLARTHRNKDTIHQDDQDSLVVKCNYSHVADQNRLLLVILIKLIPR
ncbi:hypothetical protein [Acinetobacter phage Ab69]|nr:hypothetical protein [Acinetobacter phage Ab69]